MQSQQRAEAGIREIVVGYIGIDDIDATNEPLDVTSLMGALEDSGRFFETKEKDLPPWLHQVLIAERIRKETGKIVRADKIDLTEYGR
jgi:hypothetical protein